VLELGASAEGCGLPIKDAIKITGILFSKDKQNMEILNWGKDVTYIKGLYDVWSGQLMTIIGKTNIVRAQLHRYSPQSAS
jgi:hypothetical protein